MRIGCGLAAVLLGAPGWAMAMDLDTLVPVRWPGGPLEVARREAKPVAPRVAEALRRWYAPWSLELLRGTPVNCLLVTWGGGKSEVEREQRRVAGEYAAEAHRRGIAVMGLLASAEQASAALDTAVEAGLDGLVVEGELPERAAGGRLPVIALSGAAAVSPGVRALTKDGAAQASPTSEPWIDSNLWLARSLRAQGRRTPWLGYLLEAPSAAAYERAIADASAAGARWTVALDDGLMAGLAAGEGAAVSCWGRIVAALRFFEDHAAWRGYQPAGRLGIVAAETSMAAENLNLITRRRIPFRLLERGALTEGGLAGLEAVLAVGVALNEAERAALRRFAGGGGLAMVGPSWGEGAPRDKSFEMKPAGAGRVAVFSEEEPDPESLSKDVLYLMGKDNLGLRLFRAPSVLPLVSASGDGRHLLISLVNYATEPAESLVLRLSGDYHGARLYGFGGMAATLDLEKSERGTQVKLPPVPVYAAVVLEK